MSCASGASDTAPPIVTLRPIGDFRSPSRNAFIKMVTENLVP